MEMKNYISLKEASELMPNAKGGKGISYQYFRQNKKKLCKKYNLKCKKIGNCNYFLKSEIEKLG
jgi:hypothetical protein